MGLLQRVLDIAKGKIPVGMARSPQWDKASHDYLKTHDSCACCGSKTKLQVHHIQPFHLHPERELDPTNWIVLCESGLFGINCHLGFGHLGNFKSFNVDVIKDAANWLLKLKGRPKGETQ